MRRPPFFALLSLSMALAAHPGHAIVLIDPDRPDGNPSTPGDNSGWQYEGNFDGYVGTPIAPNFFLTVQHIGGSVGETFTFHGETFHTTAMFSDNDSSGSEITDLRIWQVDQPFKVWAPLYSTGAENDLELRVFGNGGKRGDAIVLKGTPKGWAWETFDGSNGADFKLRWGLNTVAHLFVNNGQYLSASFQPGGSLNVAHLSVGDSGGGVFVEEDGMWKLAAVNYGVDELFDANYSPFAAAIYDASGYYYQDDQGDYVLISDPIPTSFYSTRVAPRLMDFIKTVLGQLPGLPPADYGTWLHAYYSPTDITAGVVIDPNADPDGDGIPNLLEFAFNLDPTFPEPLVLTRDTGNRGLPSVQTNASGQLTIQYIRRTASSNPGIVYAAQFSSDLVDWETNSVETVSPINEQWERVAVTDAAGATTSRFARVQVTTPSQQQGQDRKVHRNGTK